MILFDFLRMAGTRPCHSVVEKIPFICKLCNTKTLFSLDFSIFDLLQTKFLPLNVTQKPAKNVIFPLHHLRLCPPIFCNI